MEALLRVREVAAVLGVSRWTVRAWTRAGWLPAVRFGRLVRYRPEDVREAVAAGCGRREDG